MKFRNFVLIVSFAWLVAKLKTESMAKHPVEAAHFIYVMLRNLIIE